MDGSSHGGSLSRRSEPKDPSIADRRYVASPVFLQIPASQFRHRRLENEGTEDNETCARHCTSTLSSESKHRVVVRAPALPGPRKDKFDGGSILSTSDDVRLERNRSL